jgi:transposase-like protein
MTGDGQIGLDVPRDRQPYFDPQLLACCQRRFPDFDDKMISMFARGMRRVARSTTGRTIATAKERILRS